jgi:phosphoribosylaminoimidazole (AIR) synthetase
VFAGVPLETVYPELGLSLADILLAPHRSYFSIIYSLLLQSNHPIKALAHLTGGGFIENIPRVLPHGFGACIYQGSWPVPSIFTLIQKLGGISVREMHRVFNMGIGMVVIVSTEGARAVQMSIPEETWIIGELLAGERIVVLK